jgi:hypothetical protein
MVVVANLPMLLLLRLVVVTEVMDIGVLVVLVVEVVLLVPQHLLAVMVGMEL